MRTSRLANRKSKQSSRLRGRIAEGQSVSGGSGRRGDSGYGPVAKGSGAKAAVAAVRE